MTHQCQNSKQVKTDLTLDGKSTIELKAMVYDRASALNQIRAEKEAAMGRLQAELAQIEAEIKTRIAGEVKGEADEDKE